MPSNRTATNSRTHLFGGDIEYLVNKRFTLGNREVRIQQRSRRSHMGRFGGGWQWNIGVQWATLDCVIINLLVLSIRISKVRYASK